jgi:hypothetical protein
MIDSGSRSQMKPLESFKRSRFRLLAIASFIIRYLGWQAGIRVVWPTQRLSAHWVAPAKYVHWYF